MFYPFLPLRFLITNYCSDSVRSGANQLRMKKGVERIKVMEWASTDNTSPLGVKTLGVRTVFKNETDISVFDKIFMLRFF
jgi:hypothetical protein